MKILKILLSGQLFIGFIIISSIIAAETVDPVTPTIHPELKKHTELFEKKIYKVADNVYSAVGWNAAGIVMIEGDDSIILVDAGLSTDTSRQVMKEFRKITNKPVTAVIYSHFHLDHVNGIKGLVSAEDVNAGKITIYAQSTLMEHLAYESSLLGPILAVRSGYTFGMHLDGPDLEYMNSGHGPLGSSKEPASFIAPTHLVDEFLRVNIAGVELEIMHVPSEAPDELAVYLPASGVLIDTEVIQGPTFPNIYTLRGTEFRDPVQWIKSIDHLRRLQAKYLVPTHGQPVYGADNVEEVLRMTRDGIQYVLDQTIRYMNKGLTPDQLVEVVKLPPHLYNYTPYLRQYYGTVKQAVRNIYVGYLGWFEGDPVALDPVPAKEKAMRLIRLMGGRDKVFSEALNSYHAGDYQWAAELTTLLIRIDNQDTAAREIKAASFRHLGYASMNANWRNWYLTSAYELEGKLDASNSAKKMANVHIAPDLVSEMPVGVNLSRWSTRLKAEDTLSVNMALGFNFTDLQQQYALTIRRGICQFDTYLPNNTNLVLTLTKPLFDQVLLGKVTLEQLVVTGKIKFSGDVKQLKQFLGYFEKPGGNPISLTLN